MEATAGAVAFVFAVTVVGAVVYDVAQVESGAETLPIASLT